MSMKRILVIIVAVVLAGCGKAEEDKVVGTYELKKWRNLHNSLS